MITKEQKFALVTPSYAPDFQRCKLLAESVEICLKDETKHYIVVDRRDYQLFKQIASNRIKLLVVEDILPSWIFRIPIMKKWWFSLKTIPIRNWILQQLVKMSIIDVIDEDIIVFADSDNVFIRPFEMKLILTNNTNLALLKVNFHNKDIEEWQKAAKNLLGITRAVIPFATYTSNMIPWYRENVLKMRKQIEDVNQNHWICSVCTHWNISEYMIYGIFVEYVLGLESANHFLFDTELIKSNWNQALTNQEEIENFFTNIKDENIGRMIHSKDNISIELYAEKVRNFWK